MIEEIVKEVHPNRISFLGGLCTVVGVPLLSSPATDIYGAGLVVLGQGIDCIDGYLARRYDLRTKEGARLDPLLDKVKNGAIGTYIIAKEIYQNNLLLPASVAANFALDYISQRARGPILAQLKEATRAVVFPYSCERDFEEKSSNRANKYGKWKAGLQNFASGFYFIEELIIHHSGPIDPDTRKYFNRFLAGVFASAVVLGGIGILKRLRLKKKDELVIDSTKQSS